MKDQKWEGIISELKAGVTDPSHPFKFSTLATLGLGNLPRLRTVRIRDFDPQNMRLTFYTDSRSKKILHIKENNKVSLLFYHPEKLLQLRMEGLAVREKDEEILEGLWDRIEERSQLDYLTASAPGTEIQNPDKIEYIKERTYFSAVYILPFKIELVQLKRPNHIRIRYSKREGDWKSDYLVP
ncbi:MAG: pyridoxamine 5'-phosphate oxidase family protein [Robiginitalea sp.]|uniref:pyridoxamine 5'-phosphate oxidase family protein n=1 Tax=Robiginitalea sp. TaxID=1902411 RepID=UPI003C74C4CA